MKSILLMTLLLSLVSCVSKTEEKSCTRNGIPCDEIQSPDSSYETQRPLQEAILKVSVSAPITFNKYQLEFLENTYDSDEQMIDGKLQSCETKTEVGTIVTYRLSDGSLSLMIEKRDGSVFVQVFARKDGTGHGLSGIWESRENYGNRVEITQLEITQDQMDIRVECRIPYPL